MRGIDVDPALGNPLVAALASLQGRQIAGRQLVLTAILAVVDKPGRYSDRVRIAIDRHPVLMRFSVDRQISERIVLLDVAECAVERAEGLEKLRDRNAGEAVGCLAGEQDVVPIAVGGRYMQEVALGHIPALVLSHLLQVQGLRNDHPLIGHQLGMDIEGVAWVQGEHDPGLHLSNVGGCLPGLSPNRYSLPLEIMEILRRLSLRQLGCTLAASGKNRFVGNDAVAQDALPRIKADQGRIDLLPGKQIDRVQCNPAVRKLLGTDL